MNHPVWGKQKRLSYFLAGMRFSYIKVFKDSTTSSFGLLYYCEIGKNVGLFGPTGLKEISL